MNSITVSCAIAITTWKESYNMLVSGLMNEALSKMISNSHGDYSGVHQTLYECAQEMVDKYRQKQETPENRHKLEVKTRAATVLFQELGKVPKDADTDATREVLLSALECHEKELQGYEHLLSEKSSNYALVKQTQGLRQQAGAPASLLRYHHLKNKLLGSDSPLSDEVKEFISEWSEKKILKLDLASLDLLDKDPDFFTKDMISRLRQSRKEWVERGLADQELKLDWEVMDLQSDACFSKKLFLKFELMSPGAEHKLHKMGLSREYLENYEVLKGIEVSRLPEN